MDVVCLLRLHFPFLLPFCLQSKILWVKSYWRWRLSSRYWNLAKKSGTNSSRWTLTVEMFYEQHFLISAYSSRKVGLLSIQEKWHGTKTPRFSSENVLILSYLIILRLAFWFHEQSGFSLCFRPCYRLSLSAKLFFSCSSSWYLCLVLWNVWHLTRRAFLAYNQESKEQQLYRLLHLLN